jgi:hypothetical protein
VSKVSTTPPHTGCITTLSPCTSHVTTTTSLCQLCHCGDNKDDVGSNEGHDNNDKGNSSHDDKGDDEAGIKQQKLWQLWQW